MSSTVMIKMALAVLLAYTFLAITQVGGQVRGMTVSHPHRPIRISLGALHCRLHPPSR